MGTKGTTARRNAAVEAIWAEYDKAMDWALAHRRRGDMIRWRYGSTAASVAVHAALKALDAEMERQAARAARNPAVYLFCGEHPAFVDPQPAANDVRCVTCDDTGRLTDGRSCQFCSRARGERPLLTTDTEEPTRPAAVADTQPTQVLEAVADEGRVA